MKALAQIDTAYPLSVLTGDTDSHPVSSREMRTIHFILAKVMRRSLTSICHKKCGYSRWPRRTSAGLALLPGQPLKTPAAAMPALPLLVSVTLEALEDVVGLHAQLGGAFRGGHRPVSYTHLTLPTKA